MGKPDLILIDGGKGHLNKISQIINKEINIAAIAKPSKTEPIDKIYIMKNKARINFNNNIEPLNILINLRNEAHRFAITFHKSRRSKKTCLVNLKRSQYSHCRIKLIFYNACKL